MTSMSMVFRTWRI